MNRLERIKYDLENEITRDKGPVVTSDDIAWLISKIEAYEKTLNRIGMLQMGSLDYTEDFFEQTKILVRKALDNK